MGKSGEANGEVEVDAMDWRYREDPSVQVDDDTELDREEVLRLVIQCLDGYGCTEAARTAEREAGVMALSENVRDFRRCVLEGDWEGLDKFFADATEFRTDEDAQKAKFELNRQHYLELLDRGATLDALALLRTNLASCCDTLETLKQLSMLIICRDSEELRRRASWSGTDSRLAVLKTLQNYLSPSILLSERRLQVLLKQALQLQKKVAQYPYTKQRKLSLLEDLEYSPDRLPTKTVKVLKPHKDEVWLVEFSHDGRWLVSASKDRTIVVWDVQQLMTSSDCDDAIKYVFEGQEDPLSFLAWSPDDQLLSCCNNTVIRLWSMETGKCIETLDKHIDPVTSCAWLDKNSALVSGGKDKYMRFWEEICGRWQQTETISVAAQIMDLGVTADAKQLVTVCSDNKIHIYNTATRVEVNKIDEEGSVTSLCLAMDGSALLVNVSSTKIPPVIHEWDLRYNRLVQKYRGQRQAKFVIRSCLGGLNQMFVVSGSEDNRVYLWQRRTGTLLASLDGHEGTVNDVSWNPRNPLMFASASDDGTVRIWGDAGDPSQASQGKSEAELSNL